MKYYYNCIFKKIYNVFLWWKSWIFSSITPVFSVTWSFRSSESKSPNQPSSSPINPPHSWSSHTDTAKPHTLIFVSFLSYCMSLFSSSISFQLKDSKALLKSLLAFTAAEPRALIPYGWGVSARRAGGKVSKVLERQKKRCGWEEIDLSRGARVNQQQADSRRTYNTEVL